MERQLHRLIPWTVALLLPCVVWAAGGFRHSGEILGTHPGERTLTLRITRPEGKEILLFHVPEGTPIREAGSGKALGFEDLKPGMQATVSGIHEEGRRRAREIEIRRAG